MGLLIWILIISAGLIMSKITGVTPRGFGAWDAPAEARRSMIEHDIRNINDLKKRKMLNPLWQSIRIGLMISAWIAIAILAVTFGYGSRDYISDRFFIVLVSIAAIGSFFLARLLYLIKLNYPREFAFVDLIASLLLLVVGLLSSRGLLPLSFISKSSPQIIVVSISVAVIVAIRAMVSAYERILPGSNEDYLRKKKEYIEKAKREITTRIP
jgi:hypothetical protein